MKYYRRLPTFEYLSPTSIEEVCSLLEQTKGRAKIMAGGTILLPRWKERIGNTEYIIGLKKIPDLAFIASDEGSGIRIGAMTTHRVICSSSLIKERYEVLGMACQGLGSPQLRTMGTIGGNVCCRFPAAETIPALIALQANVAIATGRGEKTIPVENLATESLKAALITEIRIPCPSRRSRGSYLKYTIREALDYPTVNVAVQMTVDKELCEEIRIAVGAVSPFPFRAKKTEEIVTGNSFSEKVILAAAQAAFEEARPSSDMYFSADYKKELVRILAQRAIRQAWEKAKTQQAEKEVFH